MWTRKVSSYYYVVLYCMVYHAILCYTRLGHVDEEGVIGNKGRVACEARGGSVYLYFTMYNPFNCKVLKGGH